MTNALVSHEMRNPLSSIFSMIEKIVFLACNLEYATDDTSLNVDNLRKKIASDVTQIFESCQTLRSSSKLLNFCVEDMLSLAQINSNNFRKNYSNFDIRESVLEVM